jgi:hypothetical protein
MVRRDHSQPQPQQKISFIRGKSWQGNSKTQKNVRFRFAIGITNPVSNPDNPIIFGNFSDVIFAKLKMVTIDKANNKRIVIGWSYSFGSQNYFI